MKISQNLDFHVQGKGETDNQLVSAFIATMFVLGITVKTIAVF